MRAIILTVALFAAQAQPIDPGAELAAARTLYASASYEAALDRLTRLGPVEYLADQIDTYRALCLLALGRSDDSARVLEQIVVRNPSFLLESTQVSPRLIVLLREVRARAIPAAARTLYASARASFDQGNFQAAGAQLRDLLRLIDPASIPDAQAVADLRVLAEGFLTLADSMATGAAAPAGAGAGAGASADAPPRAPVFSSLNREVVAPVEIRRQLPIWDAPPGMSQGTYQGLVEVVIGETGRVESASIRKSIAPAYDAALLTATSEWRFQPATRDGLPVKYRRSYEVIVHSK